MAVCCCRDSERSAVLACTSLNSRDVLDGDHGLIGEGLQQLDLLAANGPGSLRDTVITPIGWPSLQHGYLQRGSKATQARAFAFAALGSASVSGI